ncbi:MAG: L-threonylcarbamoyladenylate synthase [Candidatus Moranbacteria bacterium]|nr:L-threonylcarbamoyladenylate synthase [Candidatus Moranbacteria bacterium]
MPKILTRENFLARQAFFIAEIKKGKVFIYPTDTLHGLGANAQDAKSIEKISVLKKRFDKTFLVIAPSLKWILENCVIPNEEIGALLSEKLPGPYSFILKLKNHEMLDPLIVRADLTIGIRLPNNWFSKIIAESGIPFVSTSINYTSEPSAKHFEDIPTNILESVDYVIWDETSSSGKASTIIDATSGTPKIMRK